MIHSNLYSENNYIIFAKTSNKSKNETSPTAIYFLTEERTATDYDILGRDLIIETIAKTHKIYISIIKNKNEIEKNITKATISFSTTIDSLFFDFHGAENVYA